MGTKLIPFAPTSASTASISGTTSTASAAIPEGGRQVRIANLSTDTTAFIKFGASDVEAAVTDIPILPSTAEAFTVPDDATHVAAITAADTATIKVTSGFGA